MRDELDKELAELNDLILKKSVEVAKEELR